MRLRIGLVAAVAAALVAFPAGAQAAIPLNDDFFNFVEFDTSTPGSFQEWTIPGDDAAGNINEATLETDMGDADSTNENDFNSCVSETSGFSVDYDKTVWYAAFPEVNGWWDIEVSGGDAVIRVIPINGDVPDFDNSLCYDDPSNVSVEHAFVGLRGGSSAQYAIQVGVYGTGNTWPSPHDTRITFYKDTDFDTLFDQNDRCPTQAGSTGLRGCPDTDHDGVANPDDGCVTTPGPKSLGGCPDSDGDGVIDVRDACDHESARGKVDKNANGCPDYKSLPDLRASIAGVIKHNKVVGVKFTVLKFRSKAPKGTKISIKCKPRKTCGKIRRKGSLRKRLRRVSFKRKKTKITIKATKKGYVGKVFTLTVTYKRLRGGGRNVILRGPKKRCIPVGGRKSRKCTSALLLR